MRRLRVLSLFLSRCNAIVALALMGGLLLIAVRSDAKSSKGGKPHKGTFEVLATPEKGLGRGAGTLSWSNSTARPEYSVQAATDGSGTALLGDPKATSSGGVQALAAWPAPDFDYVADGCIDSTKTVCRNEDTYRVYWKDVWVSAGSLVQVTTSNLQSVNGSTADTMIYVLSCSPSCEDGAILAIDDDGNGSTDSNGNPISYLDSYVEATAPSSGTIRVLVVGYNKDRHGMADIEIDIDQTPASFESSRMFGGWPIKTKVVRPGDRIWVGKDTDDSAVNGLPGWPQYHDAMLWVLGNTNGDCDTGTCGRFVFSDDTSYGWSYLLLPWLEIPQSWSDPTLVNV